MPRRGNRGSRGNRGGRRNYDENVVERHFPTYTTPVTEDIIHNTDEEKKAPESHITQTNTIIPETIHTNVVNEPIIHHSPKKNENLITFNNKQKGPNNEIQNVESFFQQTLDRESDVHNLLDDEKASKRALTLEDLLEHFMKGVQISHKVNYFTIHPTKVPEKQSKTSQQNYSSQSSTSTSSSTNKNFPQKFGQQQYPPEYMGYGQHPMMYPWMPNPEVNPQLFQQYQQMMPMFYQMFNPMMYQQQMQDSDYSDKEKAPSSKQFSNMPMPQMGYMNPNFQGENQNYYGGSQKGDENQPQFPNYYYRGNK